MHSHSLFALVLALVTPLAAGAEESALSLGYETFEFAVPHVDLADCPEDLAADSRFCRATMHSEEFHVFAFAQDGAQPLVAYKAYPAERIGEILN